MPAPDCLQPLPAIALLPAPRRPATTRWLWAWGLAGITAPAGAQFQPGLPAEHDRVTLPRAVAVRPVQGLEINYDLLGESNPAAGPARLRGVVAVPRGSLVTSVLLNPTGAAGERLARLDTRWQASLPEPVHTLVVGDTVGSGGGWSRPVRFGGLRLGRAPMLPPGTADPWHAAAPGAAALPVAGAFAPAGANDRAVTAARELIETAPAGQVLVGRPAPLPAGATDYELEAGRLRTGWGTADDAYGDSYAAAAWRWGLGLDLTAEGRAEWTPERVATGLELSRQFAPGAALRGVLAQSSASAAGTAPLHGLRRGVAMEGRVGEAGWTLAWDGFDRGFTPLAAVPGEPEARSRLRAGTTLPLWGAATATVSYGQQLRWEGAPDSMVAMSAVVPLPGRASIDLSYTQRYGPQPVREAGLKLSVPLHVGPGR